MIKNFKYIIWFLVLILCSGCTSGEYFKPIVAVAGVGVFKKTTPKCKHDVSPVDLTKEKMTVEAYNKISLGTGIFIVALVISIAFANPLTSKLCDLGMGGGGLWALIGFCKLFIVTYIVWFMIGAIFIIIIALIYRLRKRSVLRSVKWAKEKLNDCNFKQKSVDKVLR